MTPAILYLQTNKLAFTLHQYAHDPLNRDFANEAVQLLGLAQAQVFKTLVLLLDEAKFAVAIVPSTHQLSMKKLAKALGAKKATMAPAAKVQNLTGYVLGGVSPFGQKKRLPTVLDISADAFATIYVSGGKRGLELELSPVLIKQHLNAICIDICASE